MSDADVTLSSWLRQATGRLAGAGIAQADADARWIACHVLGVTRGELEVLGLTGEDRLTPDVLDVLESSVLRRIAREPLWHITGTAPFLSLELEVGPGVFTPRPETEVLAELAVAEAQAMHPVDGVVRVWDACSGSGAIGLWVAHRVLHAEVTAIEASDLAVDYLRRNIIRTGTPNIQLEIGTVAEVAAATLVGSVDLVVSNPPYLIPGLDEVDPETGTGDPDEALFGGVDGLEVIREIIEAAKRVCRPGAVVLLEHGIDHAGRVAELFRQFGFSSITHHSDLLGRVRFSQAVRQLDEATA